MCVLFSWVRLDAHTDKGNNPPPPHTHTLHSPLLSTLRQVLQVLRAMDALWKRAGLDLCVLAYECVATGPSSGMLEIVGSAATVAAIVSDAEATAWGAGES